MKKINKDDTTICRLTTRTDTALLPAVQQLVRTIAQMEGFSEKDLMNIELIVEEAFVKIVDDAFEGKKDEFFDIIVDRRPGQFVIAFEDLGLPINLKKIKETEKTDIGLILIKGFSDEVHIMNLGKSGNRMEFIKNLTLGGNLYDTSLMEEDEESKEKPITPAPPLTIRLMKSDEGGELQRCIYRVYGYTYMEDLYYPERIRRLIESGIQTSVVAVTPDDEFVAHQAYVKSTKEARVADIATGLVDPRFRGTGLFKKVKSYAVNHAKEQGLYGFYGEAVTVHPRSQKVNIALGAREMGILLAYVPQAITFKKIEEHQKCRQAALLIYTRLNREPERIVYPPAHHTEKIRQIYENANLRRNLETPRQKKERDNGQTELSIKVSMDLNVAFIRILAYGDDFKDAVYSNLKQLCINKVDCIYIDLPLSQPETADECRSIEEMGFFFSGIIPEFLDADALRLQYLNNVDLNLENVVLVTDFAKELLDYCINEYHKHMD